MTEVYEDVASLRRWGGGAGRRAGIQGTITMEMDKKMVNRSMFTHNDLLDSLCLILLLYNPGFPGRDFGLFGEAAAKFEGR